MKIRRSVMALLLAGSAVATAGPSVAAGPPTLAATVDLAGTGMVGTTVRLARPLTVSGLSSTRVLKATSPGILTVAVLIQASGSNPAGVAFQRVVTPAGQELLKAFPLQPVSGATVLPAGTYKFHLLAPGQSAMTIQLGGQSRGTTRLRPTVASKVSAAGTSPSADQVGADPAARTLPASTRVSSYLATKSVVAVAGAEFDFAVKHQLTVQSCTSPSLPVNVSGTAETPNCAGGTLGPEDTAGSEDTPTASPGTARSVQVARFGPGRTPFGLTYRTTGVLNTVFRWYFWVEY